MIESKALQTFIERELEGSDLFLVDLRISKDNVIEVELDSELPVSIEDCEKLSRAIETEFAKEMEDYTLEVGSAGLTSPLKVLRQYRKYVGKEVEVITKDGQKLTGILKDADDKGIVLTYDQKVKKEGMKRPVKETVDRQLSYGEIKQTKYLLKF